MFFTETANYTFDVDELTPENATSKFDTKYNLIKKDYADKPLSEDAEQIICRDIARWLGVMTESLYDIYLTGKKGYLCKAVTECREEFQIPGHELYTNFHEDGSISATPDFNTEVYVNYALLESGLTGKQVLAIVSTEVAKAMSVYRENRVITEHQLEYATNRYCNLTKEDMDGYEYAVHLGLGNSLLEACDYCIGKNITSKSDHELLYVKNYVNSIMK